MVGLSHRNHGATWVTAAPWPALIQSLEGCLDVRNMSALGEEEKLVRGEAGTWLPGDTGKNLGSVAIKDLHHHLAGRPQQPDKLTQYQVSIPAGGVQASLTLPGVAGAGMGVRGPIWDMLPGQPARRSHCPEGKAEGCLGPNQRSSRGPDPLPQPTAEVTQMSGTPGLSP